MIVLYRLIFGLIALALATIAPLGQVPRPAAAAERPARVEVTPGEPETFPDLILTVAVANGIGMPITGLEKDNFELQVDGIGVPIEEVQEEATGGESVAVALGLDVSGSMEGKPLADAVGALGSFVDRLGPHDAAGVVQLGGRCAVEAGPGVTGDRGAVRDFLATARAGGDTPLFDATLTAIQAAMAAPAGRRMVVMLTDGEDTCSKVTADTVVAAAVRNGIPLYFVGLGPNLQQDLLRKLAQLTGGEYLPAGDSGKLAEIYETLAARLRTRYVLTARAPGVPDGKPRLLTVRVKTDGGIGTGEARVTPPRAKPDLALSIEPNQEIDGPARLEVTNRSGVPLSRVDFFVDGAPAQTLGQAPFAYTVQPAGLVGTTRTITVRAQDDGGQLVETSVVVRLLPARLQLSVSANQKLTEPTRIEVSTHRALAPFQLRQVDYSLDGALLTSATQPPFAYTLDPRGLTAGERTLTVRAIDTSGGEATISVPVELADGGVFGAVPFWALLALALALPLVGIVAALQLSRRSHRCPTCQRRFQRGWQTCPFCAPVARGAPGPLRAASAGGSAPVGPRAAQGVATAGVGPVGGPSRQGTPGAAPVAPLVAAAPAVPAGAQDGNGQVSPGGHVARAGLPTPVDQPGPGAAAGVVGWLVLRAGGQAGLRYQLRSGQTTIGRAPGNDVVLSDDSVSRQHATIDLEGDGYVIRDLDTPNGVQVNGREVRRQRLRPGDEITIGGSVLVFGLLPAGQS